MIDKRTRLMHETSAISFFFRMHKLWSTVNLMYSNIAVTVEMHTIDLLNQFVTVTVMRLYNKIDIYNKTMQWRVIILTNIKLYP